MSRVLYNTISLVSPQFGIVAIFQVLYILATDFKSDSYNMISWITLIILIALMTMTMKNRKRVKEISKQSTLTLDIIVGLIFVAYLIVEIVLPIADTTMVIFYGSLAYAALALVTAIIIASVNKKNWLKDAN